jgi:hypothetical protein
MSVPKKHHYVPQFLLRNFADDRGQLVVHRTDQQREYGSNVRDLGHRNLGHSLFWPNREPDHASLESRMADIEGAAATAVGDLRPVRTRTVSADQREVRRYFLRRVRELLRVIGWQVGTPGSSGGEHDEAHD